MKVSGLFIYSSKWIEVYGFYFWDRKVYGLSPRIKLFFFFLQGSPNDKAMGLFIYLLMLAPWIKMNLNLTLINSN